MALQALLARQMDHAVRETAFDALRTAHALSQGTETYARLAAKDHPFAKRHPAPLIDPGIVNRHTGLFDSSWWMRRVGVAHYQLVNTAPYADFVDQGTSIMHPHTIRANIEARFGQRSAGVVARSIGQGMSMPLSARKLATPFVF